MYTVGMRIHIYFPYATYGALLQQEIELIKCKVPVMMVSLATQKPDTTYSKKCFGRLGQRDNEKRAENKAPRSSPTISNPHQVA